MKSGNVVLGVLAGLAAGAILGILLAPEKGSTTRKNIANKKNDLINGLTDKFNELTADISEKYEHTRQAAENFISKGKSTADVSKNEIKHLNS